MSRHASCEMCALNPHQPEFKSPVTQIAAVPYHLAFAKRQRTATYPCKINVSNNLMNSDFINDIMPLVQQHLAYSAVTECLFDHIQSQADTTFISKYDEVDNTYI